MEVGMFGVLTVTKKVFNLTSCPVFREINRLTFIIL